MSKAELRLYKRREVGLIRGTRYLNPGLSVLENVALPMLLDGSGRRSAERGARAQKPTDA